MGMSRCQYAHKGTGLLLQVTPVFYKELSGVGLHPKVKEFLVVNAFAKHSTWTVLESLKNPIADG